MLNWLKGLNWRFVGPVRRTPRVPDDLWRRTLEDHPFLLADPATQAQHLRDMVGDFLLSKEFSGAHGLAITDRMAVAIAAQACLPVLYLGLHWYDDFKGIVVHPGAMLASREMTDEAGIVHRYKEALTGEAMAAGPVTLSWQDVAESGLSATTGYNVVIHEFAHKLDMRDGVADGCPPLPRALREPWRLTMHGSYERFKTALAMSERFGAETPWLDAYGASAPAEFFAVACEAYFVNRPRFCNEFPELVELFERFFGQAKKG